MSSITPVEEVPKDSIEICPAPRIEADPLPVYTGSVTYDEPEIITCLGPNPDFEEPELIACDFGLIYEPSTN